MKWRSVVVVLVVCGIVFYLGFDQYYIWMVSRQRNGNELKRDRPSETVKTEDSEGNSLRVENNPLFKRITRPPRNKDDWHWITVFTILPDIPQQYEGEGLGDEIKSISLVGLLL
eukprot:m.171293 g.171293  ORF g.171293 m.171293 type:complete len:114 (+) comp13496_c0_seq4:70-411(+)